MHLTKTKVAGLAGVSVLAILAGAYFIAGPSTQETGSLEAVTQSVTNYCGDGICSLGDETNESCWRDCGCGNNILNSAWEACDDGNTVDGDGCDNNCELEVSYETSCFDGIDNDGDGSLDCDDSDCYDHPVCNSDPVCGNGIAEEGETCGEPGLACRSTKFEQFTCNNCNCESSDMNEAPQSPNEGIGRGER